VKQKKQTTTQVVKEIKQRTYRKFSAEEKIKIVSEGSEVKIPYINMQEVWDPLQQLL
jgi:hypothetical protein